MQLKTTAIMAGALAATAVQGKDWTLNTYWGQKGVGDRLSDYCDSASIDYITLGFVNNSPENGGGTNYPGTNFAAHCAADVYEVDGVKSKLLSACSYMIEDIKYCQKAGKKVLLSVGGEFSEASNYTVSTAAKGIEFADFLYGAFGPYDATFDGPRPFDVSETNHTALDGFDFDIEVKFSNQQPYIQMINRLRKLIAAGKRKAMVLTAAPQCPLADKYFQMKQILTKAKFDKIWIQYYNNPACDATADGQHMNFGAWITWLQKNTVNAATELYVGLPAYSKTSGYIPPKKAQELICDLKATRAKFSGVMLWDAYYGSVNKKDGVKFYDAVGEALECGFCGPKIDAC